jgi:Flp pilus assembly protein TadG
MIRPNTSRLQFNSSLLRMFAHGEAGNSLVETALTMMILLGVLFGTIEMCLAVYSYHFISDAAREGARYAVVRGATWETAPWNLNGKGGACDGTGTAGSGYASSGCTASTTDIEDYVSNFSFPGVNITTGDVAVSYLTSSMCTTASNTTGCVVQVQITYPLLNIPGMIRFPGNMTSTAQMVISQ